MYILYSMTSPHTKGNGLQLSRCFMWFPKIEIYLKKSLSEAFVNKEILYWSMCVYALDKLPKQSQVLFICFSFFFFCHQIPSSVNSC